MDSYSLFIIISRALFYLLSAPFSYIIIIISYIVDIIYNKNYYVNILALSNLIFFRFNQHIIRIVVWTELGNLMYHLFVPRVPYNKYIVRCRIVCFYYAFFSYLFPYPISYLFFFLMWLSNIIIKKELVDCLIIKKRLTYLIIHFRFYWKKIIMIISHLTMFYLLQTFVQINSYQYMFIFLVSSLITYIFTKKLIILCDPLCDSLYAGSVACCLFGFYSGGLHFLDKYCLCILIYEIIKKFGCITYGCYHFRCSLTYRKFCIDFFIACIIYRQYLYFNYEPGILFSNALLVYSILSVAHTYFKNNNVQITFLCRVGIFVSCIINAHNYLQKIETIM